MSDFDDAKRKAIDIGDDKKAEPTTMGRATELAKAALTWCAEHRKVTMAVACVILGIVLAKTVFAEEATIDAVCRQDTCMVDKATLKALIEHNNAATKLLEKASAIRCGKMGDA